MKIKYFFPLVIFLVPTGIGAFLIWPEEARQFAPVVGFAVMITSVIATYWVGIRLVMEDTRKEVESG